MLAVGRLYNHHDDIKEVSCWLWEDVDEDSYVILIIMIMSMVMSDGNDVNDEF